MPIALSFQLGIFVFGLLMLYKTYQNPEFIGLIGGMLFLWISIGLGSLLFDELRNFEIKGQKLIIKKPLLFKKTEIDISRVKYSDYDWGEGMYWNKMNGILIQLDNKTTIQLNKSNFKNAKEFITEIKKICKQDKTIKAKFDYKKLIVFGAFGGLILLLILINKVL